MSEIKCRNCDGQCENCSLRQEYDELLKKYKEEMRADARIFVWLLLGAAALAILFFFG